MSSVLKVPRIVKQSMGSQAVEILRESIIRGDLPAGARITEIQLAEQMDLSRATVRAALHHLAREGLTTLVPYTGWTVITLNPKDVWELYTLRSSLERLAAQLVAATLNAAKRNAIRSRFAALERACASSNGHAIAEADFAFHKAMIDLADHGRLKSQYEIIERQVRIYIRSSDSLVESGDAIVEQHRPIIEAILAANVEEAGRLAEAHNMTEGKKLTAHLTTCDSPEIGLKPLVPAGRLKNLKVRRSKTD
ncbi:GntR family transcriptional regulator [Paraburkholderia azotifigens]|uniref:GntR family transcriptional regulator n=1 Tax=Paraburkholderia azotifigens TaxID=2057004 RepID=A0A5C6V799_9BURK|nr:GntR family transcriptional regulator [Paraburkholderia azotifigens]TXC80346.1 GntR family transcriptional regulator [Paraburkholderia azotifigens]